MKLAFDHVIHYVNKPIEASVPLKKIGIHNVAGGAHRGIGTFNSLSYFDLSYIEYLGIRDKDQYELSLLTTSNYSPRVSIAKNGFKEGFSRVAIRSTNVAKLAKQLNDANIETDGPFELSRTRPDGKVIAWKSLYVGSDRSELPLPFFIEWQDEDEVRRKDLMENLTIAQHSGGNLAIDSIAFAVNKFESSFDLWEKWFELEQGETYIDETINAECRTLKLEKGNLLFAKPIREGIVQNILKVNGSSPFMINIMGAEKPSETNLLGSIYRFL